MTVSASRPTNVRWRILAIMMFISYVSYMLRGNLSIAGPAMIEDLQLTEIQWGWIMGACLLVTISSAQRLTADAIVSIATVLPRESSCGALSSHQS